MVTTLTVMKKRQIVLPKPLCEEINIREGTPMRAVTAKGSILLTPIRAPSASEYRQILRAAGRPLGKEPPGALAKLKQVLCEARRHDRRA